MHSLTRWRALNSQLYDIVYVIDASLSMGKGVGDLRPSKLKAVVETVANDASYRIKNLRARVGLVAFFGLAFPILPLTGKLEHVIRSLSLLESTGEGSAPGDALIEATKLLRGSIRKKLIILITDGDLNMGAPIELAALYAYNNDVRTCIITIGSSKDRVKIKNQLDFLSSSGMLEWFHAASKGEMIRALKKCPGA